MKPRDYILMTDKNDESFVDYTLDRSGAGRFWVPTPFGVRLCCVEASAWTIVKFLILIGLAWIAGQRVRVQLRKAPGD